MEIRTYREGDLPRLRELIAATFEGVSIDRNIEERFGLLNGTDWCWRKLRHINADCTIHPAGVFVIEEAGEILGCITTRLDRDTKLGWIPNMAVAPGHQGKGIGRRLLVHVLDYFRREGMTHAKIETLAQNEVGCHLYPSVGFEEVARQVHFAMEL
jgi:ribosomal protein S18 acetylase RimI-like enzyme